MGAPVTTGNGVKIEEVQVLHNTQGSLEFTGRELDLALDGKGFFIVQQGTENVYTRAGNFTTNAAGDLVTLDGDPVLGFGLDDQETLVPLNIAGITTEATASTAASLTGNLDSSTPIAEPIAGPLTFNELNQASVYNTAVEVIDSLGETQAISLHFFHTANLEWQVQAYVDGADVGGEEGTPSLLAEAPIVFDATGVQAEGATTTLALTPAWGNGAAATEISIDLGQFTGFSAPSVLSAVTVDGRGSGTLLGVNIDEDGAVLARLDSGGETQIGTLALADFINPNGLEQRGDNTFAFTDLAGEADVGLPGTNAKGGIRAGALENSTVDAANEFVNVIRFQRGYQAGSQVISTVNELLNNTIQIA